jgi:O-acetyl-ADP-ribose deacetylase (regulator of RNase III)
MIHSIDMTQHSILDADTHFIVNPVNCVGVMGAGLAKAFKDRFGDDYFQAYRKDCALGNLVPGVATTWWTNARLPGGALQRVINLPTKGKWRDKSDLVDIVNACRFVHRAILYRGQTIAIPMLGCGLGGLDWRDVRPAVVEAFGGFVDTDCYFYETAG